MGSKALQSEIGLKAKAGIATGTHGAMFGDKTCSLAVNYSD